MKVDNAFRLGLISFDERSFIMNLLDNKYDFYMCVHGIRHRSQPHEPCDKCCFSVVKNGDDVMAKKKCVGCGNETKSALKVTIYVCDSCAKTMKEELGGGQ